MPTAFVTDPWLRIHPDDVEHGTPATLTRGVHREWNRVGDSVNAAPGPAFAIWAKPATVDEVARNDDGSLHSVRLIDDTNPDAPMIILSRAIAITGTEMDSVGHYVGRDGLRSHDGWQCVIGARYVKPEPRDVAVVCEGLTFWTAFERLPRPSSMIDRIVDGRFRVDEVDTFHRVTGLLTHRGFTFDAMMILGHPSSDLLHAVRAQLRSDVLVPVPSALQPPELRPSR